MPERSCALDSRAYQTLKETFRDQRGAVTRMQGAGKKMVFMLGDDVPEEVILAADLVPVRLTGHQGDRPNADRYLEVSFGAQWRGCFETLTNGSCDGLVAHAVLSNSSDLIQRLYYYLLQLRRIEPGVRIPELYYLDYSLMVKEFSAQERNLRETRELIGTLEQWSGKAVTRESLSQAITLCNEHRRAVRELAALRRKGQMLGSEALTAIGGSFFVEKREAVRLLRELAEDVARWPKCGGRPVVYTGSMQENTTVYEMMETAGLNVIADDKLLGDRYADRDVDSDMDPVVAITQRYHLRSPSSERGFVRERAEYIPQLAAESGAEGLVIFMNRNDESYIWDFPKQRIKLEERKTPTMIIEDQDYPLRDETVLRARFAAFAKRKREE